MAGQQPGNSVPVATALKTTGQVMPNRLYVLAPGFSTRQCEALAKASVDFIRSITPKISGAGAGGMKPYFGPGWFGIGWDRPYLWHLEAGTKPHTMTKLAGKVIPMWINDPTGKEAKANPKAETRMSVDGRKQVLIFRKAAKIGARRKVAVRDRQGRLVRWRDAPASYPGAPGRIARTSFDEIKGTHTGKIAKLVPRPHVGVRWRNPGIVGRGFMQHGLQQVGRSVGLSDATVYATYKRN